MTEKEIGELYICSVFYYETVIEVLLAKGLIDADLAAATKEGLNYK